MSLDLLLRSWEVHVKVVLSLQSVDARPFQCEVLRVKKTAALAFILLGVAGFARASDITIVSPNTARTYAFSTIIWKQLRWMPDAGALVASITFSNYEYVTGVEPRDDERFDFAFPGITLDRASGIFYAHDPSGKSIPVARRSHALFFPVIALLPGGQIAISKISGKVTAKLTANSEPIPGERWVERDQAQVLPGF